FRLGSCDMKWSPGVSVCCHAGSGSTPDVGMMKTAPPTKSQRVMMQPIMQIRLLVFMARTMDAKTRQIKTEKRGWRRHAIPGTETLEQSENGAARRRTPRRPQCELQTSNVP